MKNFLLLITLLQLSFSNSINALQQDDKHPKSSKGQLLDAIISHPFSNGNIKSVNTLYKTGFNSEENGWTKNGNWKIFSSNNQLKGIKNIAKFLTTNDSENYLANTNDWVYSPKILLPALSTLKERLRLKINTWFELESSYDYGNIFISENGGKDWVKVDSITGKSNGWTELDIDISRFDNKNIQIAFNFVSDGSNNFKGWQINDIKIESILTGSWRTDTGGDLDVYVGWNGNSLDFINYTPPLDFNILVDEDVSQYSNFTMTLSAWDVDADGVGYSECGGVPEVDNVYFNGHYIGKLTGANESWSISAFEVKKEWVNGGSPSNPGINKVEVYVDVLEYNSICESWAVQIDWGELTTKNSSSNGVGFSTLYSDKGTDINGNGKFEYLDITATVNVDPGNSGYFNMNGVLKSASGLELAWAANQVYLNSGANQVLLRFDGIAINSFGIDGPYFLKNTTVYQINNSSINGWIVDAYTTKQYHYTDFETSPTQKPRVVQKIPADGSSASPSTSIKAVFSIDMQSSSINTNTFQLKRGTQQIAGIVSYDVATKTATLTPNSSLQDGQQYQVTLSTGIRAQNGQYLPYTETWGFSVVEEGWSQFLSEKQQLISDILGFNFYKDAENEAQRFLNIVYSNYQNGNASSLDLEAIARLTLSERVAKQAIFDAKDISIYGAKGLKSVLFGWVLKHGLQKLADLAKGIQFMGIGESISSFLQGIIDKVAEVIDRLNLTLANNIVLPPDLTTEKAGIFFNSVQDGLVEAEAKTALKTSEAVLNGFDIRVFDAADQIIRDILFLGIYDLETHSKQNDAVNNAKSHIFPNGTFTVAQSDATKTLDEMIAKNLYAKDLGNFVNTQREVADYATIFGLFVVGVVALYTAIFTGGSTAVVTLGTFGYIILSYSALVSKGAAMLEAAESIVYVDGILPFSYVNPSVDRAFGPKQTSQSFNEMLAKKLIITNNNLSNYYSSFHTQEVQNYYNQLKDMIQSGNETWATIGIDSLKYYENLASQDEDLANVEFSAAADTASKLITNYRLLATSHIVQSAARELYSASIEISAFQYRSGLKSSSVTDNAISALDSTIINFTKMNSTRTFLYSALESNHITIPNAIGLGNLTVGVISKSSKTIKVHSEIINYGNGNVDGIQVYPIVTSDQAKIMGDTLITVSLGPKETTTVDFQFTTTDSLLSGGIMVASNYSNGTYYALPGKSFFINFSALSPDNRGTLNNQNIYAYPNPFNPNIQNTKLRFKLANNCNVTIKIYDVSNFKIRDLVADMPVAADIEQSVVWDGRDNNGNVVANGVYFFIVESSTGERGVGKIAVLK